eukprot:scaffold3623_cov62-Cylindrotheca_fusiformis.AAC.1
MVSLVASTAPKDPIGGCAPPSDPSRMVFFGFSKSWRVDSCDRGENKIIPYFSDVHWDGGGGEMRDFRGGFDFEFGVTLSTALSVVVYSESSEGRVCRGDRTI